MIGDWFLLKRMISFPVYSSGSIPHPGGWTQPIGWSGPQPVLYWSFDILDGSTLMEGNEAASFNALVPGKVRKLF